jgi:hypothetical protein
VASAQPPQPTPKPAAKPDVKSTLIQLDKQLAAAEAKHDGAALKRLFAEEFKSTDQKGTVRTKAEVLQHFEAGRATHADSSSVSDYEVRLFGNTAVMTHTTTLKEADGSTHQLRATHVWSKGRAGWQMVADSCTAVLSGGGPHTLPESVMSAACSEASFEPEVRQFYGNRHSLDKQFERDGMKLPQRRAYMLLVEGEDSAELSFFERVGGPGSESVKVSSWQGRTAGDLRERLAELMLANKGIACIGRQAKAFVFARYTPEEVGPIPAPVSPAAAFSHSVKRFGDEYVRATVFLLC